MGKPFAQANEMESLRIRNMIQHHFALQVRGLPPEQFCAQGFVLGKAAEAGFGNEMYKILTAAALSVILNRSLIIGQTRHIGSLSSLSAFVIHFDYEMFEGNISSRKVNGTQQLEFRSKDWGPAPRWVAFVDFFSASRAKHAVVSGAQRRVGTTYAQLIAALAATNHLGDDSNSNSTASSFSFLSSFQHNMLSEGLKNQVG